MVYQRMVIKDDRIEVIRKDATKQLRPIKCPYAQWNDGNCHPDCVFCGDYTQIPRRIPNVSYVDHVGIAIHLECGHGMDLICEDRAEFADLRTASKSG